MGPRHLGLAFPLNGLATVLRMQGRYEEAKPLYQQALSLREQHLGPQHLDTAQTLYDLALFWQKQDRLDQAIPLAERALAIRSRSLGDTHGKTVAAQLLCAQLLQQRDGRGEEGISERQNKAVEEGPSQAPVGADDPLQAFLSTCCEVHPRAWSSSSALWQAYQSWAKATGERFPLSRPAFSKQLKRQENAFSVQVSANATGGNRS